MFKRYSEENKIEYDSAQLMLLKRLGYYQLRIEKSNKNIFTKIFTSVKPAKSSKCGIYIHGDVGRGKSMLMNLFFDTLKTDKKLKVHFYEFMQDIHKSLHIWSEKHSYVHKAFDPLPELANKIADKYNVICFDELQVNNIADAMILYRLFKVFFDRQLYIFFTSNRIPEDLFKDGLQREHFLPFIDLVNKQLEVIELNNYQDYRLKKLAEVKRAFIYPINKQTKDELNNILFELTERTTKNSGQITVGSNRKIHALNVYGKLAEFTFTELCVQPLGAIDYLSLAHHFSTLVIHNIPKLSADEYNEALRFITLIDCFYECRTRLICLSEVPPEKIYSEGKNAFEFRRTSSRLIEMSSQDYLAFSNTTT